jgi:hypothetical protein
MSSGPYKAQTAIEVADQWYVEICIEATLSADNGDEVRLKGEVPIRARETDLESRHLASFRRLLLLDA